MVAFVEEALVAKSEVKVFCALKLLTVVVEKAVVNTPVVELYASGNEAESDVEEILLLKLLKDERSRYLRAHM